MAKKKKTKDILSLSLKKRSGTLIIETIEVGGSKFTTTGTKAAMLAMKRDS